MWRQHRNSSHTPVRRSRGHVRWEIGSQRRVNGLHGHHRDMWRWCRGRIVALKGDRVNRNLALDVDKLDAVERDSVREHTEMHIVDGHFEGGRLGEDQDVEYLSLVQGHSPEPLLGAPNLVGQTVAHNAVLGGTHTHMESHIVTGSRDAARLQVYHESGKVSIK